MIMIHPSRLNHSVGLQITDYFAVGNFFAVASFCAVYLVLCLVLAMDPDFSLSSAAYSTIYSAVY